MNGSVGGIGIFTRNDISAKLMPQYYIEATDKNQIENVWQKVVKYSKTYLIGRIYRHPNQNIDDFSTALEATLDRIV